MNKFEQMLAITPALLALNACGGRGGVDEAYAEGYQDGYHDGKNGVSEGQDQSHAKLCETLLDEAEEAYEEGLTANVTVDGVPNTLESGYDGRWPWMRQDWITDDGNGQLHVPCTSLLVDDEWTVSGEAVSEQDGPYLSVTVVFPEEPFKYATVLDLQWVVMTDGGARFATDLNGNVDTLYPVDPGSDEPIRY